VYCEASVDILVGSSVDNVAVVAAVKAAVDASDPVADTRGPVDFKKYVAGVIVNRAIQSAKSRA
jgi:carbon-monoxide dehydrogenase medium subunit